MRFRPVILEGDERESGLEGKPDVCEDCSWRTALRRVEAVRVSPQEVRVLCWTCYRWRDRPWRWKDEAPKRKAKRKYRRYARREGKPEIPYVLDRKEPVPRLKEWWIVDFGPPHGTRKVQRALNTATNVRYWKGAPKNPACERIVGLLNSDGSDLTE